MRDRALDAASFLLRLGVGLVFIPHGYAKVFGDGGPAAFAADMPGFGIPAFLGYIAAYAEFFGAILLIAGLLTRLDAFLLGATMFVAAFIVQIPDAIRGAEPGANRFFEVMRTAELPIVLLAASLAVVLIGPGRFSLDHLLRVEERILRKNKTAAEPAAA